MSIRNPIRRPLKALRDQQALWLRGQYATGRAGVIARPLAKLWSRAFALGLLPRRWVDLEVRGRRSGLVRRFPVGLADLDGRWYAVSMLGECAWTKNVRAAGGRVTLRRRKAYAVILTEVPVADRAAIIKAYLTDVPGGRPHIPVDYRAPVADFAAVAPGIPVFAVSGAIPPPR